jgi:hypothetical protein
MESFCSSASAAVERFAVQRLFRGRDFVMRVGLLKQGIALQRLVELLLEFQRGELQQADGLLQLGRHGELLAEP